MIVLQQRLSNSYDGWPSECPGASCLYKHYHNYHNNNTEISPDSSQPLTDVTLHKAPVCHLTLCEMIITPSLAAAM